MTLHGFITGADNISQTQIISLIAPVCKAAYNKWVGDETHNIYHLAEYVCEQDMSKIIWLSGPDNPPIDDRLSAW